MDKSKVKKIVIVVVIIAVAVVAYLKLTGEKTKGEVVVPVIPVVVE